MKWRMVYGERKVTDGSVLWKRVRMMTLKIDVHMGRMDHIAHGVLRIEVLAYTIRIITLFNFNQKLFKAIS